MSLPAIALPKATKLPGLAGVSSSSLQEVVEGLKKIAEVREGRSGNELDRAVTVRDLFDAGLISVRHKGRVFRNDRPSGSSAIVPIDSIVRSVTETPGGGGAVPEEDLTPPPAPTGLTANGAMQTIILEWDEYAASSPPYAYTKVYRAAVDDLGQAVWIGDAVAPFYADSVGQANVTRYYWISFVSRAGIEGPKNAVSGTPGATGYVMSPHLADLAITADKIATGAIDLGGTKITGLLANLNLAQITDPTKIADSLIGNAKLAAGAVTATKIADGSIDLGSAKITGLLASANLAVIADPTKIADSLIGNTKLADAAVTAAKIATGAVSLDTHVTDGANYTRLTVESRDAIFRRASVGSPNLLYNPGLEDGGAFWRLLAGASVVTDAAKAHSGNRYLQLTRGGGEPVTCFAADDAGNTRYFEVTEADTIVCTAWVYRENGDGLCRTVIAAYDKDKANPSVTVGAPTPMTGGWTEVTATYTVASGKQYVAVWAEIVGGAADTTARFDDFELKILVGSTDIVNGAITSQKLADLAVESAKLASSAVTATKIANLAVGTAAIQTAAITTALIATAAIGSAQIADLAVSQAKIQNAAVGNLQVADAAISAAKIGTAAVGTAAIQNAAITSALIANLAVGSAQIASAAITSAKIGSAAVGTAAIQNAAITSALIANLAVGSAQIADAAITSAKIGSAAIGAAAIANLAVGTAHIQDAAITNAKIGNLAVDSAKIADGAIVTAKIGNLQVTLAKIADASISTAKIGVGQITSALIATAAIQSLHVGTAQIQTAHIQDAAVETLKLAGQAVTIPVSAYSASAVSLNASYITIQTATIASTGAPVHVIVSCRVAVSIAQDPDNLADAGILLRVYRSDGVVVWGPFNAIRSAHGAQGTLESVVGFAFRDTPGAVSRTYYLQAAWWKGHWNQVLTGSCAARSILLLETKR